MNKQWISGDDNEVSCFLLAAFRSKWKVAYYFGEFYKIIRRSFSKSYSAFVTWTRKCVATHKFRKSQYKENNFPQKKKGIFHTTKIQQNGRISKFTDVKWSSELFKTWSKSAAKLWHTYSQSLSTISLAVRLNQTR